MPEEHLRLLLGMVLLICLLIIGGLLFFIGQPGRQFAGNVTSADPTLQPGRAVELPLKIDAARAWGDVQYQVELGARLPGSIAHAQTLEWMAAELTAAGWSTEIQETTWMDHPIRNVIGKWGEGRPWLVLGAHFDSRMLADHDPDPARRNLPVPGANDGASGVAVLLELARNLPGLAQQPPAGAILRYPQVWIVFFDAEDNGGIADWEWIMGSRAFVAGLSEYPEAAVIVDMVGDADLNIYFEQNSDPLLMQEIWRAAGRLGYRDYFIPVPMHSMLDDHTSFLNAGIRAVDIIDYDYTYWHTTADTPDKVSPQSLKIVGDTLLAWMFGGVPYQSEAP